jgi:hypothetical protein
MPINDTNTGTQYIRYPTDYNLKQLSLFTSMQGTNSIVDLAPFMIELNLYEDIYSSTISGEVVLQDSLGLISNYLLNGTEFVQVQLQKTAKDNVFISRNYRVYKISKRQISDSNQYEVYVLNFISEEFILSEQYRLSKSAKGKQINDIIADILTNYLKTKKKTYIDTTKGVYDFILPNKKLFETINWLSTYALPIDGIGADMLFYENSQGYHFHSLQSLFQSKIFQTYKFDPKNILNTNMNGKIEIQEQLTNVFDFEMLDFFDTLTATSNGTFANKVIAIDPLLRKYDETTGIFNYNNYNGKKLNSNPLINGYQNRLGGNLYSSQPVSPSGLEMGTLRMSPSNANVKKNSYVSQNPNSINSVANDIMLEVYLPNRVSQLALANYMRIKITIAGDPILTAGSVVTFNTYGINPVTYSQTGSQRTPDPLYSGNYLVTAVRHIIKNNGYITVLEMCKDSVATSYSTNNSDLQQFIDGVQI